MNRCRRGWVGPVGALVIVGILLGTGCGRSGSASYSAAPQSAKALPGDEDQKEEAAASVAPPGSPVPAFATPPAQAPKPAVAPAPASDEAAEALAPGEKALDRADLEREATSVEEAERQLALAEQRIDVALGQQASRPSSSAPGVAAEAPAAKRAEGATQRDCAGACRAFASLQRAGAAICRLAGDSEPRCKRAQLTVATHRQKVMTCGCRPTP